jgi:hypothetical protein
VVCRRKYVKGIWVGRLAVVRSNICPAEFMFERAAREETKETHQLSSPPWIHEATKRRTSSTMFIAATNSRRLCLDAWYGWLFWFEWQRRLICVTRTRDRWASNQPRRPFFFGPVFLVHVYFSDTLLAAPKDSPGNVVSCS